MFLSCRRALTRVREAAAAVAFGSVCAGRSAPSRLTAILACGILASAAGLAGPAGAQTVPAGNGALPGMRFSDAELLSPSQAWSYFSSAPATVTYSWGGTKPWEIVETARGLEHDPQKIFAYVKNYVRYEPRFGAQKGAVGAIIDRSGTAFDQAQLLVELLRASGVAASYQVGVLTLTGPQFSDWIGITDPAVARQFLANGGIPAVVTGSGSISQVQMGHAWVVATINGSQVTLDPSYKVMDRWAPIDVAAESGLSASTFVPAATSAYGAGLENGVPFITGVDLAAGTNHLNVAAGQLLGRLGTVHRDRHADEIIGLARIRLYEDPWANRTTGSLDASWGTHSGGLPDRYRTKLAVRGGPCRIDTFADEIYGRRLQYSSRITQEAGPDWHVSTVGHYGFALNGQLRPGSTFDGGYQTSDCINPPSDLPSFGIRLDLPYAARANASAAPGTWMDRTSIRTIGADTSVEVVLGWGETSSDLQARLADDFMISVPSAVTGPMPPAPEYYGPPESGASLGPATSAAKLYAAWLAQMARGVVLLEAVSANRIQHHYTIGVVYSQVQGQVEDAYPYNQIHDDGEPLVAGAVHDTSTRIDLDSGFSSTTVSGAPDQLAVRHTIAALGAMLEGSVFEQQQDAVDTASTAQRFPWGQENLPGTIRFHRLLPGDDPVSEYREGAGSSKGAPCRGQHTADLGYAVIQANDRYLGPGTTRPHRPGVYRGIHPKLYRAGEADDHMQRGCAWIAFNADASEIAHVITSVHGEFKGAGGASEADLQNRHAPEQADLLKDTFQDRSSIGGVDLRTGTFTYRPEPDLVIGQGDFPYALSFQRTYQAGGATCPKCPWGWTHNLDIRALVSGGGLEGMGRTTPLALAAPLVGIKGAFEIYKADPTATANQLAAMGVMRWLAGHLTNNVTTVVQGASSESFVRLADGSFAAPRGSQSTLLQTGQRRKVEDNVYGRSPIWLYDQVSLVRRSGKGDEIAFTWRQWNPTGFGNDYGSVMGHAQGFFASSWTFPQGVTLSFSYCEELPITYGGDPGLGSVQSYFKPCADQLRTVQSSLGLAISVDGLNAESSDGRAVYSTTELIPFNYTDFLTPREQTAKVVTGFIDAEGNTRAYEWQMPALTDRPNADPRLVRVRAPADLGGMNRPPAAQNDQASATAGVMTRIYPLANDTDPDGDQLRLSVVETPQNGSVSYGTLAVDYTSSPGFSGTDSFTYTASDNRGGWSEATVYVNVSPAETDVCPNLAGVQTSIPPGRIKDAQGNCVEAPNQAPTATADSFTFNRRTDHLGNPALYDPYRSPLANDSDPDGEEISYAPGGVPTDFQLQSDGRLLYTNPAFTYGAPRNYTYTIVDSRGATASANIAVTVPDRPPVMPPVSYYWYPGAGAGNPGGSTIYPFQGAGAPYDPDGNALRITGVSRAGISFTDTALHIHDGDFDPGQTYTFTYTATDGYHSADGLLQLEVHYEDPGGCYPGRICN